MRTIGAAHAALALGILFFAGRAGADDSRASFRRIEIEIQSPRGKGPSLTARLDSEGELTSCRPWGTRRGRATAKELATVRAALASVDLSKVESGARDSAPRIRLEVRAGETREVVLPLDRIQPAAVRELCEDVLAIERRVLDDAHELGSIVLGPVYMDGPWSVNYFPTIFLRRDGHVLVQGYRKKTYEGWATPEEIAMLAQTLPRPRLENARNEPNDQLKLTFGDDCGAAKTVTFAKGLESADKTVSTFSDRVWQIGWRVVQSGNTVKAAGDSGACETLPTPTPGLIDSLDRGHGPPR